jgi:hypothetical protein
MTHRRPIAGISRRTSFASPYHLRFAPRLTFPSDVRPDALIGVGNSSRARVTHSSPRRLLSGGLAAVMYVEWEHCNASDDPIA